MQDFLSSLNEVELILFLSFFGDFFFTLERVINSETLHHTYEYNPQYNDGNNLVSFHTTDVRQSGENQISGDWDV